MALNLEPEAERQRRIEVRWKMGRWRGIMFFLLLASPWIFGLAGVIVVGLIWLVMMIEMHTSGREDERMAFEQWQESLKEDK